MEPEDQALQATLDDNREQLAQLSHSKAAQLWLKPSLRTPSGTDQLLEQLERHIQQDSFLVQLERDNAQPHAPPLPGGERHETISKEWWEVTEVDANGAQASSKDLDSYVVVEREDVVEAIGAFVAAYLATLPEARNLQPKQLQQALGQSLKELRLSRLQQFWRWGKSLYRCAAVTYGAFSLYTNPWLVRAVLAAIWTASRILTGLL